MLPNTELLKELKETLGWFYEIAVILVILLLSWLVFFITKRYIVRLLHTLSKKSATQFDDIFVEKVIANRLAYISPILVLYLVVEFIPKLQEFAQPILLALIALVILLTLGAFINLLIHYLQTQKTFKGQPVKSYGQVIRLAVYILGGIFIIGLLTGSSPLTIFSGLGAMTAILILVFRDTILSFVASIQISTNDLVRIGDWIEVRSYGADGDVIDIALHTVKIQNWDKTISIIPTHKLIESTFINWRGMQKSGGRRIKRAINLDISSIRFCDDRMTEKFKKIDLIQDYIARKEQELTDYNKANDIDNDVLVNGRRMTNIGTFRHYIECYLRNHDSVNRDMTFLIRQLAPGDRGLPIEIYVFANDTAWVNYENIQADIFDHLLAVVPEFGLSVFQNPSGSDFRSIGNQGQADGAGGGLLESL